MRYGSAASAARAAWPGWAGTAGVTAVVDATHPFAETISAHAVDACAQAGLPLLRLARPGWTAQPGDDWRAAASLAGAAAMLPALGGACS